MRKVVHGKVPQYLKDLTTPSERLHVHANKQLLPRTRIDIFKCRFFFSGSLAWNSLAHHLRYPIELKTFKRKAFQALAKPPSVLLYTFFFFFRAYFTCSDFMEIRESHFTAKSLRMLFQDISPEKIFNFLKEMNIFGEKTNN